MKFSYIKATMVVSVWAVSAIISFASSTPVGDVPLAKAKVGSSGRLVEVPAHGASNARQTFLDINSASKDELAKLPGISRQVAEKIIKNRPYLSDAILVTNNVITLPMYLEIKSLIIARQKNTPIPKSPASAKIKSQP